MTAPKILIADDDRDSAQTLADLLRLHGHDVRVAFDGGEAVALAHDFAPSVAILDLDMPVIDGYDTARAMRRGQRSGTALRILALSSHATAADIVRARQCGFDRHLPKGVGGGVLLAVVGGLLDAAGHAGGTVPLPIA